MFNEKNYVLSLFTRTWIRDSHGLYDYESIQTKNLNAVLADSVIITRKKHDIRTTTSIGDLQDEEFLINVKYEKIDKYFLENQVIFDMEPTEKNISDLSNKIWYVLKQDETATNSGNTQNIQNTNEDYYLCKNDIIKLGRVKYALNEIYIPTKGNDIENDIEMEDANGYNTNHLNVNSRPIFDFIYKSKISEKDNEEESNCKICYNDSNDLDNPLVHLCKCSGGIRFAHYQCIKKWMETKLIIKENEKKTVKSYNIKSFNCEICKTPYPLRFQIAGRDKIFDLIDIVKPDSNYIILESLNQMKENCNIKSIHVICLTDDTITIGRGHESDVRINDISVSRSHAWLKYNSFTGKLNLRDLKSKFGTLVLLKRPLQIKEKKIHLQIGRTYIEASLMNMKEFEKLKKEKKNKQHKQNEDKDIQKQNSLTNDITKSFNNQQNFNNNNKNNDNNFEGSPMEKGPDGNDMGGI